MVTKNLFVILDVCVAYGFILPLKGTREFKKLTKAYVGHCIDIESYLISHVVAKHGSEYNWPLWQPDLTNIKSKANPNGREISVTEAAYLGLMDTLIKPEYFGCIVKYFKQRICAFFSKYKGQKDLPSLPFETPGDNHLFRGGVHRWFRNFRMCSGSKYSYENCTESIWKRKDHYTSFLLSILMSKKGMCRPSAHYVQAEVKNTFTTLTTAKVRQQGDEDLDIEELRFEYRRTIHEMFLDEKFTMGDLTQLIFPGSGAAFDAPVGSGGRLGRVVRLAKELDLQVSPDDLFVGLKVGTLHGKLPDYDASFTEREEQKVQIEIDEWLNPCHYDKEVIVPIFSAETIEKLWKKLFWNMFSRALDESGMSEIVGLAEALKVRPISKGPAFTYTVLNGLQKFLWRSLQKHQVFSLIGKPITPGLLEDAFTKHIKEGFIFLSGDYRAATDNLFSEDSEFICREIASYLRDNGSFFPSQLEDLFVKALVGHKFMSPFEPCFKPQLSGQTMGSIVSFPILCIINATLCRMALERSEKRTYRLRDDNNYIKAPLAPLLINGDDCVLMGNPSLYEHWKKITSFGGLEESIGKTYVSSEFLTINSTYYNVRSIQPVCVWDDVNSKLLMTPSYTRFSFDLVNYLNLGLFYGISRNPDVNGSSKIDPSTLGSIFKDLCLGLPDTLDKKQTFEQFLAYHKNTLEQEKVHWFLPEKFGGLGLCPEYLGLNKSYCDNFIVDLLLQKNAYRRRMKNVQVSRKLLIWDSCQRYKKREPCH